VKDFAIQSDFPSFQQILVFAYNLYLWNYYQVKSHLHNKYLLRKVKTQLLQRMHISNTLSKVLYYKTIEKITSSKEIIIEKAEISFT